MGLIGQIIYGLLSALLPFLFSGKQTDVTKRVTGMNDMDRDSLTGAKILPPVLVLALLIGSITGCVYAGKKLTVNHILIDAGGYVEIAQDEPILLTYQKEKTQITEPRNMAGAYALPKSVYNELRAAWIKAHPESALLEDDHPVQTGIEEEKNIVISAEPVVTGEIADKHLIQIFVLVDNQKKISSKVLFGWEAMSKSLYLDLKTNWEKSHK
jgi:hypothetical protein